MAQTETVRYKKYWDEERETLPPEKRKEIILERIKEQLHYVYNRLPFYRRLYDAHNFKPDDVKTLEDFTTKVPVVTKKMLVEDQQKYPPFGSYAGDFEEKDIARIQGSSGTSGTPTFYRVSKEDWQRSAQVHAMAQWAAGVRPDDIVQIAFPFSLFFGGWGVLQGAEVIGATILPLGAIESERQLDLMMRVKSTVFSSTPSHALHLISRAAELGIDLRESTVKRLIVGGEPGGGIPTTKKLITEGWNASVHDCATASEMYPFQTHVECEALNGVHCYIDEVYTEITKIDNPNVPAEMGERGAVVYTHLWRKSQPMIRFWVGDESYMTDEPCSCGRTYPRLPEGILGRIDDMFIVRGVNIYPSAVEKIVRSLENAGPEYKIILEKQGALDEMKVILETKTGANVSEQERLREEAERRFRIGLGIRVTVEVVQPGVLEKTTFKARRVVDNRKK